VGQDQILFGKLQVAETTPFDNSTNGFTAEDVQTAIEEVKSGLILIDVDCDSTVFVSAAVRLDVTGKAFNALADGLANSNVIGIVVRKSSSVLCDIRVSGVTNDIFAGLDETADYFLSASSAGVLTTTAPSGSGEIVLKVGQPFDVDSMVVATNLRMVRV